MSNRRCLLKYGKYIRTNVNKKEKIDHEELKDFVDKTVKLEGKLM